MSVTVVRGIVTVHLARARPVGEGSYDDRVGVLEGGAC